MAETVTEENKKQTNVYGITAEVRKKAQERLEQMIKEKGIKAAKTAEELLGPETGQTQEEIQEEVDGFLKMIEEDREFEKEREV